MGQREVVFNGGFLLTEEKLAEVKHFEKFELPGDLNFWHDPFKWLSHKAAGDRFVLVYGHWAHGGFADHGYDIASVLLGKLSESRDALEDELSYMAGRYLVIAMDGNSVYMYNDAIGNRTVYYSKSRLIVCSHLNLLLDFVSHGDSRSIGTAQLQWAVDYTNYDEIRMLLPNFRLDCTEREIERFYPSRDNQYICWSEEERYEEVERLTANINRQYFEKFDKVAVSMTGGYDSRLSLSTMRSYWDRIHCFTYGLDRDDSESTWGKVMQGDYQIVSELLTLVKPKQHRFIELSKFPQLDAVGKEIVDTNTVVRHGRHLLPVYRSMFPTDGWLHIRGNGPEVWRTDHQENPSYARILKLMQDRWPEDLSHRAHELGYDDGLYGYNRYNMIYWELRHGKWLSEIQNETDYAFETRLTMDARRIIDILLSFSNHYRKNGLVVRDLINRSAPVLNFVRLNGPDNMYEMWRGLKVREIEGETGARLENVHLRDCDGNYVQDLPIEKTFVFPKEFLKPGYRLRGQIFEAVEFGALCFRVIQRYANANAGGSFEWRVLVNGEIKFYLDGAAQSAPVNVSVINLEPGDLVEFEMESLRDMCGYVSWENATRTSIDFVDFYGTKAVADSVQVRTDCLSDAS